MKPSNSLPFFPRENSLTANLLNPAMLRRVSTTDKLYREMHDSPLHDLCAKAEQALTTRFLCTAC